MRRKRKMVLCAAMLFLASLAIVTCAEQEEPEAVSYDNFGRGGGDDDFKIPLPKGYEWEVSQSWAEHCEECDRRYPPEPGEATFCESSHATLPNCEYSWDFNLPGETDNGKPVLASANGEVKFAGYQGAWGNTVILDHGDNLCSRYAHMRDSSITVDDGDEVCQGLKLGEVGNTGGNWGSHLHFQFEDCRTGDGVRKAFEDGNGILMCGDHPELTNDLRTDCEGDDDEFGGGELPEGGWLEAECGALRGCPLIPNCGRESGHVFSDSGSMEKRARDAAAYLYSECAVDGKSGDRFDPNAEISRAEALKISMYLFGRIERTCPDLENFRDVDEDDWFFNLVNCALDDGVVNDESDYFRPEDPVTFTEAAKMAVAPAVKAGVIHLQNPSEGHFYMIPKSHWAYKYVETLYYYGALVALPDYCGPEDGQSRRTYAIMVASLSPCFCYNIDCDYPCECNQETFSCSDPDEDDPGQGGGDDDDDDGSDWEDVLEIEVFVDEDDIECEDGKTNLHIKVTIENDGDEDLRISNLVMEMTDRDDMDVCYVSDPNLRGGTGYQVVEAGETRTPNGHYEILCEEMPDDGEIEVSFDLLEKDAGEDDEDIWRYEVLEAEIEVEEWHFEICDQTTTTITSTTTTTTRPSTTTTVVGTTSSTTTTVPPSGGAELVANSSAGSVGILLSTWYTPVWFPLPFRFVIDAPGLPASFVINPDGAAVAVWFDDSSQQMECWNNWSGFEPPARSPDSVGNYHWTSGYSDGDFCRGPI